jgi:threonine synthase
MRYLSTRSASPALPVSEAMQLGLAGDGGLFLPESLPAFSAGDFGGLKTLPDIAHRLLAPFFEDDVLAPDLAEICAATFDFPAPLVTPKGEPGLRLLELFHGPTAAFKDFGARFLAQCMSRCDMPDPRPLTVLVATSGDTGGAVAAGFHGLPGIDVAVLYPEGRVSPRQERQLTCWGGNVHAFRVRGDFDACQRMVKGAFADPALSAARRLCSANSINIGRLLPQMVYYAAASLALYRETGEPPGMIVPTGNLGNALACLLARRMGLPIGPVVLATNANRTIPDFLRTSDWQPRSSIATLASAMDVGNPSNMERVRSVFGETADAVTSEVRAYAVEDAEIEREIVRAHRDWGEILCPHTATAAFVCRERLGEHERESLWTLVATAHPAKFETVVEPLIGTPVPVPAALARLLELPSVSQPIDADVGALRNALA